MGRKRKAPEPPSSSSSDSNGFNWVQDHVAAASLAYKEENESDMDDKIKLSEGWQIHKTIEGKSGVKLKIWVSPKNGNVMIGFRGTSSMKEMRLDASLGSTAFQNVRGENVGYVYKGFAQGWEDIKPALEREMNVLRATSYVPDGATLQFAGHSLGGALAEIASTYFADVYPNVKVAETSIGAPTSGDKHFGEYSRSRLNLQRMRIVAAGDPVANVKLPGMEYVENTNVLNFSHTKKSKTSWETFKKVVGSVMPSIAIGNQLYDSYKNHSLGSYEETLLQDFQDESILTLRDDPETLAVEAENQYQASKEGDMPMEDDGSCLCECHIYDKALTEGKIAPVSLGTIPKTKKPTNKSAMASTNDPMAEKVTNSEGDQIMQSALQLEIQQSEEDQKIMAEADVSDIMDMINEGLEKQKSKAEKSREDTANQVAKLQEQYANLTNQHEAENFDTVSLERNRFTQASDDLGYFQMRIDMELENPAYVPNDSDGSTTSRDKAIKFKNRMNKVYSLIMSVKSKQYAATLDPDYKEISDKEKRETLVADQVAQTAQATKDGDLNPDEQQNEYVFDIDTLTDMDGPEPQTNSLKIIQQNAGDMVSKLGEIVWLTNPGQDSLLQLTQRLEEYLYDMAMVKNFKVKSGLVDNIANINLSAEIRRNIYLLFKEAINNAVKYSNATLIELHVKDENEEVKITLQDNGNGFDKDSIKRGNGLTNMEQRAKEAGINLRIESVNGKGTLIAVSVKIPC